MKISKKQQEVRERLEKYDLSPDQIEFVWSDFLRGKATCRKIQSAIDQAARYKRINSGEMRRDFAFIFKGDCDKKRGVYRITFGNKFYVGRAKLVGDRMRQHKRVLREFFEKGNNNERHFMKKIFDHLNEDKCTYFFEVELLESAYTVESLQEKEQKWLDRYRDDPRCLNLGFIATKPEREIEESVTEQEARKKSVGVYRRNGRVVFYNKEKKYRDELNIKESGRKKYTEEQKAVAHSVDWGIPKLAEPFSRTPIVYKLFYGEWFLILKSMEIAGSLYVLQRNYGYYVGYDKKIYGKGENYMAAFYDTIRDHPGLEFRIELILQSDSGFDLLMAEQKALDQNTRNKKCKNSNVDAYVNKYNEKTRKHNWLEVEDVERFYEAISKPVESK